MSQKHKFPTVVWVRCPVCAGDTVVWHVGTGEPDDVSEYIPCTVCNQVGWVTQRYAAHWRRMNEPLVYELPKQTARVMH